MQRVYLGRCAFEMGLHYFAIDGPIYLAYLVLLLYNSKYNYCGITAQVISLMKGGSINA